MGTHIGNALEVKDAIDVLAGRTRGDLLHVSLELGSRMLLADGRCSELSEARTLLEKALQVAGDCGCKNGCPSCTGPVGEIGQDGKKTAMAILRELTE